MGSEIERIVDRKSIRGRVHYLVVWRGFGEESNTWESRMDLVADGYASVIRDYENSRKDTEDENGDAPARSPSRGRSPGRGKSPAKSPTAKSTSRPRGRPRSNSATGARGKRSSSKSRDASDSDGGSTGKRKASASKSTAEKSTNGNDAKEEQKEEEAAVLKQTLAALEQPKPAARAAASSPVNGEAKKKTAAVQLSYESTETVTTTTSTTTTSTTAVESPKKPWVRTEVIATEPPALQDLWNKLNEGNWLLGFVSVVVVAGSLLASQVLPVAEEQVGGVSPEVGAVEAAPTGQWRLWLPFLTPLVALLLVFHQRDARAFVKWIAIALSWRIAAELSVFFEFAQVALGAAGVAYTALVVALVSIARSGDLRSKSTLVAFVVGALMLALSDSWIAQTQNVALPSRVNLMSASALLLALSPRFTASVHED